MGESLLRGEGLPDVFVEGRGDNALCVGDAKLLGLFAVRDGDRSKTWVRFYELFANGVEVLVFSE
jgi:hypothetical protein